MSRLIAIAAALLASSISAVADTPPAASGGSSGGQAASPSAAEAQIPFANHGEIYSWDVVDDKTVLIQTRGRKWYKATLMSPCIELPFTERLGFESNPDGSFDKFSSIKVRGQTCPLVSLVESPGPAKKPKTKKDT